MDLWAYRNGVKIDFFRPGKPINNAFVESFNGTFRNERVNTHSLLELKEATRSDEGTSFSVPRDWVAIEDS